jgi:hypothetical protein
MIATVLNDELVAQGKEPTVPCYYFAPPQEPEVAPTGFEPAIAA